MADFDTVTETTESNTGDFILVRQVDVDRKSKRSLLSEGVSEDITNNGWLDNTTSQKGLVKKATQGEVDVGINDENFITPLKLRTSVSTTTRSGVVRLATGSETQAGTASNIAITPAGLVSRTATETRTGILALATESEVDSGANSTKAVTPMTLNSKFESKSEIVQLSSTIASEGIKTLSEPWDDFEEIIIVYAGHPSTEESIMYTYHTPIITPSDSTTTYRYILGNFDDKANFNFRNSNRSQLYFKNIGDDDTVLGVYGKGRK